MRSFMLAALFLIVPMMASAQGLSGRRAPSFALPDHNMKPYDILDYRGRWLLVDFMKTDCPFCKQLTKMLDGVKAKLGAKIGVLGVVVIPENTQTVGKYILETKTTTPIVFDSGQTAMWYFKATPQNPAFDTPHLFAINPQGRIVRDWNQSEVIAPGFVAVLEGLVGGASVSSAVSPAAAKK